MDHTTTPLAQALGMLREARGRLRPLPHARTPEDHEPDDAVSTDRASPAEPVVKSSHASADPATTRARRS